MRPSSRLAAAALALLPALALGQAYPNKAIRATVGTPTGGPGDVVLRGVGQAITNATGQAFVVENRVSVSSIVSMEACSRGAPDGYTLCSCDQQSLAINPVTRSKLSYPADEIVPIILNGFLGAGIHVHPSVPANTLQELFALAKAKPNSVTFGSFGPASAANLYIELWKKEKGIEFLNVPYKAASLAYPALLGGEVQAVYFAITGAAAQNTKAGKVKTLAVMLDNRSPDLPNVPTYKEAGIDVALVTWFGLCAPPKTPRDIVSRLNGIVAKGLLGDAELRQKFVLSQGMVIEGAAGGPPEAFAKHIAQERERYARIVKIAGVKED
jgi:tripartite-type tricarboxylate transporter receptor subunit TctC